MLQPSSSLVADTDVAAQLTTFMAELTEGLLPARERYEALVRFSLLTGLAFARLDDPRRAALCSDGTPLEWSLSIDNRGRHALRYVCDVAAGMPDDAKAQGEWFRSLAEKVTPRFPGSSTLLDRLFKMHLHGAPDSARFKVWFGAGLSAETPRTGMLYFNTEWLRRTQVIEILAPHFPSENTGALAAWADAARADYDGIAYDFDPAGVRKVKVYLRPGSAGLETCFKLLPGAAGPTLSRLIKDAFGANRRSRRGGFMVALGLPAHSTEVEASVYLHLESWGVHDFAGLTPILRRMLGNWDIDLGPGLSRGPRGCVPTLLSFSTAGDRPRLAVYFKPLLTQPYAEPVIPTAELIN
jgi:hypothetical protein